VLAHCSRCHGGTYDHRPVAPPDAKILPFRRLVRR
jgi:hypothetical protein